MKTQVIFYAKNLVTNKYFIGSHPIDINYGKDQLFNNSKFNNDKISIELRTFKPLVWQFERLCRVPEDKVNSKIQEYIKQYNSINNGYNEPIIKEQKNDLIIDNTKNDLIIDNTKYSFLNKKTKLIFTGTLDEFISSHSLDINSVNKLIDKTKKIYKNWSLI